MSRHYTVVIKVVRTDVVVAVADRYGKSDIPATPPKDSELATIAIRSDTLTGIVTQAKAHLDLVEEVTP